MILAGGKDKPAAARPTPIVKTVTQQGRTVQQTVTVSTPAPTTAPATTTAPAAVTTSAETTAASTTASTTTAASAPRGTSGDALNAQAYRLMQSGDYAGALPILQQAVQALQGQTGDINNGYANYNLAITLIRLGRCSEAVPYLEAAKQLEPDRHEVDQAMKIARKCG
jgi:TolA-binding protein